MAHSETQLGRPTQTSFAHVDGSLSLPYSGLTLIEVGLF